MSFSRKPTCSNLRTSLVPETLNGGLLFTAKVLWLMRSQWQGSFLLEIHNISHQNWCKCKKKKQYFMLVNNLDFRFDLEKEIYSFKQLLSVHYIVGTMRSLERQTLFASGTYGPVGKQIYTWDVQETWLWHVKKLLWYNMIHAWKEMNLMHHYISLEEEVYRIIENFTQEGAWTNKWMVSTIQLLFFWREEGRKEEGWEGEREGGWGKGRKEEKSINCSVGELFLIMCAIHLSAFITFALLLLPLLSNYTWEPTTDGK